MSVLGEAGKAEKEAKVFVINRSLPPEVIRFFYCNHRITEECRNTEKDGKQMNTDKRKKAQSIVEYAVAFVVVVSGIIAIGFIANARNVFENHFDETIEEMK